MNQIYTERILYNIMRPVCIYSPLTTEASNNPAGYMVTQQPISPFTPRWPKSLLPNEEVCWHLKFNKMPPPTPDMDSEDEEYLSTAGLDDPVWSEEPVSDSHKYFMYRWNTQASNPTPTSQSRSARNPIPAAQSRRASNPTPTFYSLILNIGVNKWSPL